MSAEPISHPPHLDPSTIWWSDLHPSDTPSFTFAAWPSPRRPRIALSIAFLLGSLLFAPLAPACWWLARAELRGMNDGTVADEDRGWFGFVRVWGASWTVALLGLLLFWLEMRSGT
jgi:hypothetical protein